MRAGKRLACRTRTCARATARILKTTPRGELYENELSITRQFLSDCELTEHVSSDVILQPPGDYHRYLAEFESGPAAPVVQVTGRS